MAAPPCGPRRQWSVLVESCEHCGGAHQHRTAAPDALFSGQLDRVCAVTGQAYVILVARVAGGAS